MADSVLRPLYREIAARIVARANCEQSGNNEWRSRHSDWLAYAERELLPSGSGIDCGTKIDLDRSTGRRIVLTMSFHHMNENGFYDGWTEHTVTIVPAFDGIDLVVGGRDRNGVKEYLADTYYHCLKSQIDIMSDEPRLVMS